MFNPMKNALIKAGFKPKEEKKEEPYKYKRTYDFSLPKDIPPKLDFYEKPKGRIVGKTITAQKEITATCSVCNAEYTKSNSQNGKRDVCRGCSTKVKLKTGEMIWTHKTAPILHIHGEKPPTPEQIASSRRR